MRLRVLGTSGGWPAAGRACSGYLLRGGGALLAVDAGSGALAELQRHTPLSALDAWWVTHLHADHCSDLLVLFHALAYGRLRGDRPLRVLGPPGWPGWLDAAVGREGAAASVFEPVELEDRASHQVAGLALTAVETRHSPRTFGLRAAGERETFAYSADSGDCPQLAELASGADLFLCEAFLSAPGLGPSDLSLTPEQAGAAARAGGARRLLLTHLHPGADPAAAASRAARLFPGPVAVARPGELYDLA